MTYRVSIEGRGEILRYTEEDRYLEADVTLGKPCTLSTWCARRWAVPKDVPLTESEFALAVTRMVAFLVEEGLGRVTINERRPETATEEFERLRREGSDVYVQDGKVVHKREQFETSADARLGIPQTRRPTSR